MVTSLEELRNSNGEKSQNENNITRVTGQKTLAETDPAFIKTSSPIRGGGSRTPVIDGSPKQPSIKVVNAKFDPSTAKEFDINTLEKRKPEKSEFEKEIMADLDKAVAREKESITERINAITEMQRKEFEEQMAAKEEAEYKRVEVEEQPTVKTSSGDDDIDWDNLFDDDEKDPEIKTVEKHSPITRYVEEDTTQYVKPNSNSEPIEIDSEVEEDNLDMDEDTTTDTIEEVVEDPKPIASSNDISDDLDKDLAAEIGEEVPDTDSIMKRFAENVKERITPITKRFNLNDFTVGESPITCLDIKMMGLSHVSVADHFLPNAGKIISCSALSGSELMAMNPENSNRSRLNTLKDIYSIMYKHVVSEKPKTFDEWLKTTRFNDLEHIYFALYKATFGGSNFMTYECPNKKCQDVFIEDVSFEDMINYADDEIKTKMQAIMSSGDSSITPYEIVRQQISNNLAIGIRNPSIYNVVIEVSGLSDSFLEKYQDLMDIIVFIDNIYYIDYEHQVLEPVDFMPDKNNIAKTIARRIKIIADILRSLPSDNYFELRKAVADAFPSLAGVTYKIPAATCKKCGTQIPERVIGAQELLFMRHQLGAFVVL